MSASEMLRALEQPVRTQLDVLNNALRLHEAQPQIAALVELEDEFMRECEEDCLAQEAAWPPLAARDDLVARKYRALARLRAAIAEPESTYEERSRS